MSNRNLKVAALLMIGAVQLFIIFSMIFAHENVLKNGIRYKMKSEIMDPYDPFRGRYIRLSIDNRVEMKTEGKYKRGSTVYVSLNVDPSQFVKIEAISKEKPTHTHYIKTKILNLNEMKYEWIDGKKIALEAPVTTVYLDLPFTRYYMEESLAPKVEQLYREQIKKDQKSVYITFRVLNGKAVLENLYIKNIALEDYLKIHKLL